MEQQQEQQEQGRTTRGVQETVQSGDIEGVKKWIEEEGHDVNEPNVHNQDTILILSCRHNQFNLVKYLCENGNANVNQGKSNDGATPFFIACQEGYFEIV